MIEKDIISPSEEASVKLLQKRLSTVNDTLQAIIAVSLSSDTLPQVDLLEKPSIFISLLNRARGYSKAAGANREQRTVTLEPDTQDRDVAHELAHFIHWDIQDEKRDNTKDSLATEKLTEEQQLVHQAWEEGVAVFVEMEFVADSLLKKYGKKLNPQAINQRKTTVFAEMYKEGQDFQSVVEKFKQLCSASTRYEQAKEAAEKGKDALSREKVSAIQIAKDIKTMATSKELLYDVGYSFVVNAVEFFMNHMPMAQSFEIVMSNPPLNVKELEDASIYCERVNSMRKLINKNDQ